jgi:hypothetical protein
VVADITKRIKHATGRRTDRLGGAGLRILLGLVALTLAFAPREAPGQSAVSKEYQVKAAFLFNFVQFVEWPPVAFTKPETPICIGVLGDDPFGTALDDTVHGETVQSRKLVVQRSRRVEDLKECQLIFISKSETERVHGILGDLDPFPVLTVSEAQGFAQHGGIINLYLAGNKVRFEINLAGARRKGLKISSELLSLGKITEAEPVREKR